MMLTKYGWLRASRWMQWSTMALALAAALVQAACAQGVSTTTVQGTVYLANGQPGAGTLVVSWPAFTTSAGQAVAADSTTVTIPADGFVSVNLAPNQGATPSGQYYTATFYMSDGSVSTQYWVVPAGAQATLAQVQSQVMPAAQAVQAVSKAYVDQAISSVMSSQLAATGGTLSGPLYLSGDPTQPLEAADKHYVDTQVATAVPLAGGNMTGGVTAPAVNGVQAPATGSAQTTLQAAMNAAGTNGAMEIPPTYTGTDTFTNANGVRVTDLRTTGSQQTTRSVKEFGAVCDGVTDDTNALQAALNYANAHGVALTIPEGVCKTHTLTWRGESIGGMGKLVSALMGFPGQDVLESPTDATNMLSFTRIHDLTIYVDQSEDVSCTPAEGQAAAGSCQVTRPMESSSIFSAGGNGLTGTVGTGAAWSVGNCAIAMPATTGAGGNGLSVAEIDNVEIAATGTDPVAAQYPGAHSTHTCGMYLAQWPQWSDFRNIDIRGVNTGIAIPALPETAPAGLTADSNRWQNITIQATHAFTAAAGSNNVLDNVVAQAGNSAATGEPPTGLVLDLPSGQQGWTVRNAVVTPVWNAVEPQLTVTAAGGAVTAITAGPNDGWGWDPYGTSVPVAFSGSCTAQATAAVNANGTIGSVTVTQGGVGCSSTTTATINEPGTWDTAAPVNLIGGQDMTFFAGNLLKGNGGYTVWDATGSESYGTQLDGGGGTLPGGGSYAALAGTSKPGATLQVDQFPGADFGAKLQACVNAVNANYGGTCDARNFTGNQTMGSNLTIATPNTAVLLPCATITTASQIVVTAGTRNVALRGCALRGGTAASGSQGGTVFAYTGAGAMVQVGDATYATDTPGFHMDNAVINTTGAASGAQGLVAYRTQELDLESLYFLGNQNQTGMTLDGTGNYTGGTFLDDQLSGFGTAVNAIGHQVTNPATTDWMNASTFVRLHIDCPTSGGSPVSGTYGINLQQGDGNTFTGGDVEGCSTALHLGPNAQDNTIVGLRNENSTNQVVADAGSAYNDWMTGGTMFTGELTDNGTRNSFFDTFHRSFNGLKGDWYGSQQDATVTNHYRLGIGTGNERGLEQEYQTDYGYRWEIGLSDGTTGIQNWSIQDLLNNVGRIGVGQYLSSTANVITNVILNNSGCYTSSTPPTIGFSGGGGSGASASATMYQITTGTSCAGGYGVASVTMTNPGSGYTSQPTVTWSGSNQTTAPNAIAEITTAGSTNNQTVINAAGTGAVVLNGSNNAGTGGVVFGSGGPGATTVATIDKAGNAQFDGTLLVGGTAQSTGTITVRNDADAEVDYYLWPGLTTSQKGSFTYKDWNGNSQWYMVKDTSNNWALNSAVGGLDSFKAYQSMNSGDTYIDASNSTGHIRLNYESGAGAETDIYSGPSASLDAAFLGPTSIKLPGLAASSGYNCLQIDNSGYITNTGAACSTGVGTVTSGSSGQIAYYTGSGTAISGESMVPLTAGGTGAATAAAALANLGGVPATGGTMTGALTAPQFNGPLSGNASSATALAATPGQCPAGEYATGVTANGTANCTAVSYSQLSGTTPTWNQNTTGTASNVTGTVGVGNGGTGATTAVGAMANLLPGVTTNGSNGLAVAGNTQLAGALSVSGAATFAATPVVENQANTEIDAVLQAGLTASQKESLLYRDWNGNNQWSMMKDASNNWALNSGVGGLDSFKAFQSTNSGDTYIDASNSTGAVRVNYETGSGAGFDVYGGNSGTLLASIASPASVQFPGLAAGSGHSCLQVDSSGYITNTGSACGSGTDSNITISSSPAGEIAYYSGNGSSISGMATVPVTAGGTGAATAAGAIANLLPGVTANGNNGVNVTGAVSAATVATSGLPVLDLRNPAFDGGAVCNGTTNNPIDGAFQAALNDLYADNSMGGTIRIIGGYTNYCYFADPAGITWPAFTGTVIIEGSGLLEVGTTFATPYSQGPLISILGYGSGGHAGFVAAAKPFQITLIGNAYGTLGTAINPGTVALTNGSAAVTGTGTNFQSSWVGDKIWFYGSNSTYTVSSVSSATSLTLTTNWSGGTESGINYGGVPETFTPSSMTGLQTGAYISVVDTITCSISSISLYNNVVTAQMSGSCPIPAGSGNLQVSGVANSAFDGTFQVATDNYVTNTLTWDQTGANASSSGGTVSGMDSETPEVVGPITVSGSNVTASFYEPHSATAEWGVVALAVNSPAVIRDVEALDYDGLALFVGPTNYKSSYIRVGAIGGCYPQASWGAQIDGGFATYDQSAFLTSCSAPWGLRVSNDTPLAVLGGGNGDNTISHSFIGDGVMQDKGASQLTLTDDTDEHPTQAFLTYDYSQPGFENGNGFGEIVKITGSMFQDSESPWGTPCIVNFTYPGTGSEDFEIDQFAGSGCVANYPTFNGQIRWTGKAGENSYGLIASIGPQGTINDGKKIIGEMSGQDAGLGPSVVPYSTYNVTPDLANWTCSGNCSVTPGMLAPDGTFTAYAVTASQNEQTYLEDQTSGAYPDLKPQAGDIVLYGGRTYSPNFGAIDAGNRNPYFVTTGNNEVTWSSAGISYVNSQSSPFGASVKNQGWHNVVGMAQVTASTATASLPVYLAAQVPYGQTQEYWNPFLIYIPVVMFTGNTDGMDGTISSVSFTQGSTVQPGMIVTCTSGCGSLTPPVVPTNDMVLSYSSGTVTMNVPTAQAVTGATFTAQYPLAEVNRWRMELLHGAVPPNFNQPGVAATAEPIATNGYYTLNPSGSSPNLLLPNSLSGYSTDGGSGTGDTVAIAAGRFTQSTSPVCPNGAHGELTTSGCTGQSVGGAGTYAFTTTSSPSGLGCSGSDPYTCTAFPTGNYTCTVYVIAGGNGGGSGAVEASGTAAYGGGGGTSGPVQMITEPCSAFGSGSTATVTITVGAGGAGGAAQTALGTSGNNGSVGGNSSIIGASGYASITALNWGGVAGSGGTTTSGTSGTTSGVATFAECGGGSGSSGTGGYTQCLIANAGEGGGAGGGGVNSSGTASAGGSDQGPSQQSERAPGYAGTAGGAACSSGQTPTISPAPATSTIDFLAAVGGTGGGGCATGNGGAGGNGMFPGGGGAGGGGALNGYASGAGGAGGNGLVLVIVH